MIAFAASRCVKTQDRGKLTYHAITDSLSQDAS